MKQTVQLLKIEPILENGMVRLVHEIISKEVDYSQEENQMLEFFYKNIGCDTIDVVVFGSYYEPNHFAVTVDDEGLLKSGNVVMKYTLPIGDNTLVKELSGTVLFGKVAEIKGREDDGMFEVGLTKDDIEYLTKNLQFDVLGITR